MNMGNQELQKLNGLFKKESGYDIQTEVPIEYDDKNSKRRIDLVIGNKQTGRKAYVMFKTDIKNPAHIGDVMRLDYVKMMDEDNGKKNNYYMIYCPRKVIIQQRLRLVK